MAHGGRQLGPGIGLVTQTFVPATPMRGTLQHAAPTDQPSASLPELEKVQEKPPQATAPLTPAMEGVEAAKVMEAVEVLEAAKVVEARETEEDMAPVTLVWTQIHPSRVAIP